MKTELETLAVGGTIQLGGEGVSAVCISPVNIGLAIRAYALHSGEATGAAANASLTMYVNGSPIAKISDANFANFQLQFEKKIEVGPLASPIISIYCDNNNAKTNLTKLQLFVTRTV